MYMYFFTRDNALDKSSTNISRNELQTITKQHFQPMFHCFQVDTLFKISHLMLRQLQIDDENFDRNYDSIIFGTIVIAKAVNYWKYQREGSQYALHMRELMEQCGITEMADLGFDSAIDDIRVQNLISAVGKKILDQIFPFGENEFKVLEYSGLTEHAPLKQRLNKYRSVEDKIDDSDDTRHDNLFHFPKCSIL